MLHSNPLINCFNFTDIDKDKAVSFNWDNEICFQFYMSPLVEDFLHNLKGMQFHFEAANNRGNHAIQAYSYYQMKKLGFNGKSTFIYEESRASFLESYDDNKRKVFSLFNINPENKPKYYVEPIQNIEFISETYLNGLNNMRNGIVGSWSQLSYWEHKLPNVQVGMSISPFHYKSKPILGEHHYSPYVSDTFLSFKECATGKLNQIRQVNTGTKTIRAEVSSLKDAKAFLELNPYNDIKNIPVLNKLISLIENQDINFWPIYGSSVRDEAINLVNFMLAGRYIQHKKGLHSNFTKPLVLSLFFEPHAEYFNQVEYIINKSPKFKPLPENLSKAIKSTQLQNQSTLVKIDGQALKILSNLEANTVTVITLPELATKIFQGLYTLIAPNVFPQVKQGGSSFPLLITTGHPHIHCNWVYKDHLLYEWEIDLELASEDLKNYLIYFTKNICSEGVSQSTWTKNNIHEMIAEYVIQASDQQSPLSLYFAKLKEVALTIRNDRIRYALFNMIVLFATQSAPSKDATCLNLTFEDLQNKALVLHNATSLLMTMQNNMRRAEQSAETNYLISNLILDVAVIGMFAYFAYKKIPIVSKAVNKAVDLTKDVFCKACGYMQNGLSIFSRDNPHAAYPMQDRPMELAKRL